MTEEKRPKDPQNGRTDELEATLPLDGGGPDDTVSLDDAATATVRERPGERLGRYRLLETIGEGGFGTVFLAEQLEPVSRRVALKIIKLGMDTREVIARFEAERQALALMDHPGIARVLDAGATASGRPYFVMELVRGIPITEYCDRRRLDTRRRLALFRDVCAAVQHAHHKGVIHRDIKPSNVLVSEVDGRPVAKVIDFGIAKATNQRLTEKTVFTAAAQFIGTPAYMSPEQAGAETQDIDTRSDIYSLGVLLYELLAGSTPFDGRELRSAGYGEIQRIIREEEPPWPSSRASRLGDRLDVTAAHRRLRGAQLVRKLRGELDWIVMKCLEKDRARRYETANGLARDVERFLSDEPVAASPPSRTYRLKKLIVRNRAVFAAGAAMFILLAAGVVGTGVGLVRARQAESEAVREAAKSDQVAGFLTDMLAGVGPSAARGRDTEMLEEILAETDERLAAELGDQPEVEGEIRSHLGMVYFDLGEYEQAKQQYRRALELLRAAHGEEHGDVARQYSNLGLVHEGLREIADAEENHGRALDIRRRIFPEGHSDLGMNLVNLGNLLVTDERYADAEPLLLEGVQVLRSLAEVPQEELAIALNSLGNLMQHLQRYGEAGPYYEQALAIHRDELGEDHPYVITDIYNLGWLAYNTSDFVGASERFGEALDLSRRVYGESHPKLIEALTGQARVVQRLDDLDGAEALFREAWDMAKEIYGPDHLSTASVMNNLSICLTEAGRDEESDELVHQVYEIQRKQLGEEHPTTLTTRHNIGYSYYTNGDYGRAVLALGESLVAYEAVYGREHKNTAQVLNNLGRALRGDGRLDEAAEKLIEARGIRSRILGEDHLMVAVTNHDLSLVRFAEGRYDEAGELLDRTYEIYAAQLDTTHRAVGSVLRQMASVDLELGRPESALGRVERARRITVAARGADFEKLVEYDVIAASALGLLGRLDEARGRLETSLAGLENLGPRQRALVDLDLGRHFTVAGKYEDAERSLLSSYGIYAEAFGAGHPLTRKSAAAAADLYEEWAGAGSAAARDEVERWRRRATGG